jgi:hypothetical protein
MLFACPCCGYRTLPRPVASTTPPCEICAWDFRDHDADWTRSSSELLSDAQQRFLRTGSSDPALAELTRPPRPDEPRASWWLPIREAPAALIALIEGAFAEVQLDGGVSFAEAELIDDYAMSSRTEFDPPPRGYGSGPPWQALTLEDLDRYHWGNFSFQDARGIRYHLPALLCVHLRGKAPGALDSLMFTLTSGHQLDALLRLLTPAQRHAVARYLAFLAISPHGYDEYSSRAALRKRWGVYLDEEHLAQVQALLR